ncbi:hypothetical protein V1527DRAFT_500337 [Lipomyces starkeyi]
MGENWIRCRGNKYFGHVDDDMHLASPLRIPSKMVMRFNSTSGLNHAIAGHENSSVWDNLDEIRYGYKYDIATNKTLGRRDGITYTWLSYSWDNSNQDLWNDWTTRYGDCVATCSDAATYIMQHRSYKYCMGFIDNVNCPLGKENMKYGEIYRCFPEF